MLRKNYLERTTPRSIVQSLSWYDCKVLLESHGYAVYHWEPVGDLRETILDDIRTGNIELGTVQLLVEKR